MPLMYVLAEVVYFLIVRRMILYELSDTVIETMVQSGNRGFINVGFDLSYLGSNETAKNIIHGLGDLAVDDKIRNNPDLEDTILAWIRQFESPEHTSACLIARKLRYRCSSFTGHLCGF